MVACSLMTYALYIFTSCNCVYNWFPVMSQGDSQTPMSFCGSVEYQVHLPPTSPHFSPPLPPTGLFSWSLRLTFCLNPSCAAFKVLWNIKIYQLLANEYNIVLTVSSISMKFTVQAQQCAKRVVLTAVWIKQARFNQVISELYSCS